MRIAVLLLFVLATTLATARPAGHFGFGSPPSYPDLSRDIEAYFHTYIAPGDLVITRPAAACRERGFIKRDLCGYRFCMKLRGKTSEAWFAVGLGVYIVDESCEITEPWIGNPPIDIADFCEFQPKHDGCRSGLKENYQSLSVDESTGDAAIAREKAASEARVAEEIARAEQEKARAEEEVATIVAAAEAAAAKETADINLIKSNGAVRAYAGLATYRYKKCQDVANVFLQHENKELSSFDQQLEAIRRCAAEQEAALTPEVRTALQRAPGKAAEQVKELHAYTIASLRSLTNFHQSEIEARQARSERMAGIDERATRLELEL